MSNRECPECKRLWKYIMTVTNDKGAAIDLYAPCWTKEEVEQAEVEAESLYGVLFGDDEER